jgi:tetratricopeptide (TPR) repeat protein
MVKRSNREAQVRLSAFLSLALVVSGPSRDSRAGEIEPDTTWQSLRNQGRSLIFGRLTGSFDGPEYRDKEIRVRDKETGQEHRIPVEPGLGDFAATLPTGSYFIVTIDATYIPAVKPMDLERFPPVHQRYALSGYEGLPSFPVVTESPLYLGTIRSNPRIEGMVYEGHRLEILDELPEAWARLAAAYPALTRSLTETNVEPRRYFFVKPQAMESALEVAAVTDGLALARDYIAQGKYRQAIAWLQTTLPASDSERLETRLLLGEASLGDRNYANAIDYLGEVLQTQPENTRALRLLARAHALNGDGDDALDLYRALVQAIPSDAEASLHIGFDHALRAEAGPAARAFTDALSDNFDYLLHDSSPYDLAMKAGGERYEPPRVVDGVAALPAHLLSRRAYTGGFALLLDHRGRLVAAHLTNEAQSWAPAALMSLIRARFRPARLNGVAVPCLFVFRAEDLEGPR